MGCYHDLPGNREHSIGTLRGSEKILVRLTTGVRGELNVSYFNDKESWYFIRGDTVWLSQNIS